MNLYLTGKNAIDVVFDDIKITIRTHELQRKGKMIVRIEQDGKVRLEDTIMTKKKEKEVKNENKTLNTGN